MKFIVLMICSIALCSCGVVENFTAGISGRSKVCVDGIQYIQFTSGASVAYNTDGTIKICKE